MVGIVRIKRRLAAGGVGTPASLANAELAYNEASHTLYYGEGTGGSGGTATSVVPVGGSGAFLQLNGGTINSALGGWSSSNYGKQLLLTGAGNNPALGVTDSAGANLIGIINAAGVLRIADMPAYTNSTTAPVNLLSLDGAGSTSHTPWTFASTTTHTGAATFGSTVTLAADPTAVLHATTKQYTDAHAGVVSVSDTPPSGILPGSLWWDSVGTGLYVSYNDGNSTQWVLTNSPSTSSVTVSSFNTRTGAVTLLLADITGAGGAPIAGPTFTGTVTLAADPTLALQAVTKQYVDRGVRQVFGTIALLRANTLTALTLVYVEGYAAVGGPGGGAFRYVLTDTTSADNGGTIIVDAAGQRWYRETEGATTSVHWFGAVGDGVTNDTTAIQAALNASLAVHFPAQQNGAQAVYVITAALTLRVGHQITGAGIGVSVVMGTTASQTIFSYVSASQVQARIRISNMQIRGGAATVIGISTVFAGEIRFSNIEFYGTEGDCIRIDRGYFHLIESCTSRPNPTGARKAGRFYCYSSDNADYCFYPTLRDIVFNTGEEVGVAVGIVATTCIHFRRVIEGGIYNFQGERLDQPTNNVTDGVWLENDCQGCKIVGGSTHGAKSGVVMFQGTGPAVAPGYSEVVDHDVDYFTGTGVQIQGGSSVCADITIQNCVITAGLLSTSVCIIVGQCIRAVVSGNTLDNYQTTIGSGIELAAGTNSIQVMGNTINNFTTGLGIIGSLNVNMIITNNVITSCTNAFIGDVTSGGLGTNTVRGNRGTNTGSVPTPAVPASGGTVANTTGYDVTVYPTGGVNMNWAINGIGVGGATGGFFVPANGNISVTYTGAPAWTWVGM